MGDDSMTMHQDLSDFLAGGTLLSEESVNWGGNMPLQITSYLCNKMPPLEYISSVRALVFQKQSVLVITSENGEMYITPGGRVEKGEMPLETLRRELLEEAGWSLSKPEPLACMHFHHLAPKPEGYNYPYPDFLWLIYHAEAGEFFPGKIIPDDYVSTSRFKPIDEVKQLLLAHGEGSLLMLEAALKLR